MRAIQEVGTEILGDHPASFYVFGGSEWGVKDKYLSHLAHYYSGNVKECQTVESVLSLFRTKRLVPLPKSLYIVRYDEVFASKVNDKSCKEISECKISGTVVLVYESGKHFDKVSKYLPDFCVIVDKVSNNFVEKYVLSDYPELSPDLVAKIVKCSSSYGQAKHIAGAIVLLPESDRAKLSVCSDLEFCSTFGINCDSSEVEIKRAFASRNFAWVEDVISRYPGDISSLYYVFLSSLIELEKLIYNKYTTSDLREFVNRWSVKDIYNMFMQVYRLLQNSRSASAGDPKNDMMFVCSLLGYSSVPALEDLL